MDYFIVSEILTMVLFIKNVLHFINTWDYGHTLNIISIILQKASDFMLEKLQVQEHCDQQINFQIYEL